MLQLTQFAQQTFRDAFLVSLAAYWRFEVMRAFNPGFYHACGLKRTGWFWSGTAVPVCYSLFLNSSRIDFGKLLRIYVVLFFVVAQIAAKMPFHQTRSEPIYLGGALVVKAYELSVLS